MQSITAINDSPISYMYKEAKA